MNWIGRHLSRMAGAHSYKQKYQIWALDKGLIMNIFCNIIGIIPIQNNIKIKYGALAQSLKK